MKILHVNKFFDVQGGAEVYMHQLMNEQRKLGHEVHAFSTKSEKNLPSDDKKSFVTRYDLSQREGLIKDTKKAINYLYNLEAKRAFSQLLDEVKPDIIHLHNIYNHLSISILGEIRKRKIPCVQTLHDYKLACPNYKMYTQGSVCERCKGGNYTESIKYRCSATGLLPNILAAAEMYMTKSVQAYEKTVGIFLCPSQFLLEKMIDWGEPKTKMRLARNPVTTVEQQATRGGGYILYIGRLSQEKGLLSFLEAACKLPQLPVKIVGRGPHEEILKQFVQEKGATHIEFTGHIMPDQLGTIRDKAEAFVMPPVWYENSSLSILEGMAAGLPMLVTRIGGNPELIEDGVNGFLAKPGDSEDWYRALHRFLATTSEIRAQMGEASRKKIYDRHRWDSHLKTVMGAYRELGACEGE